jgi:ribosomal protein S18 acetylase RimI-like enzyme
MHFENIKPIYTFDVSRFDFAVIHEWLSQTYWSPGIERERVEKGFRNSSVVVGAFIGSNQIGAGRCISDTTRFAYIADIFVHPSFRHQGIARKMVEELLNHPSVADVTACFLFTKDAHDVYYKQGFEIYPMPERLMMRKNAKANHALGLKTTSVTTPLVQEPRQP